MNINFWDIGSKKERICQKIGLIVKGEGVEGITEKENKINS